MVNRCRAFALMPDIDIDVPADIGRRRFMMAVVPVMGVMMVGVVIMAFIAAWQGKRYDAQKEGETKYVPDNVFHIVGFYLTCF